MSVLYRKIQIETPFEIYDHDDTMYSFNSIEGAVDQAMRLSSKLKAISKVVDCTYYKNGDYKRRVIATINYSNAKSTNVFE